MISQKWQAPINEALSQLKRQSLYRQRRIMDSPQCVRVVVDGKAKINFCSNDYLGLANHPQIKRAFQEGVEQWGVGSGSAHLICGHSREHHALEEELAAFTKRPRALLFSTGYMANLGITQALLHSGDVVFEDKLNHASLIDGGLHSKAEFKRFHHADMAHLESLLKTESARTMIVSDGVFSMDGDIAILDDLVQLAARHNSLLMIDDAHGIGVLGEQGGGLTELSDCGSKVPVLMGTLGKAFGTAGAFVVGSEELVEILIQQARPYIYTTAMPPAIAAATRASLKLVQRDHWRREQLAQWVVLFQQLANDLSLPCLPSKTPIQALILKSSTAVLAWGDYLYRQGFLVSPIRPPTVPKGSARLRFTLSAGHSEADIRRLFEVLERGLGSKQLYINGETQ